MINDDLCLFMMIYDDLWWFMMIYEIYDDLWWFMMIYDDLWWFMMIYDDLWWFMMIDDDWWWFMMICDDLWWFMMIYDDLWWFMMIYDDLWWFTGLNIQRVNLKGSQWTQIKKGFTFSNPWITWAGAGWAPGNLPSNSTQAVRTLKILVKCVGTILRTSLKNGTIFDSKTPKKYQKISILITKRRNFRPLNYSFFKKKTWYQIPPLVKSMVLHNWGKPHPLSSQKCPSYWNYNLAPQDLQNPRGPYTMFSMG